MENAAKRAEVAFLSRIMELEKEADPNYNPRLVTSNEKRISDLKNIKTNSNLK